MLRIIKVALVSLVNSAINESVFLAPEFFHSLFFGLCSLETTVEISRGGVPSLYLISTFFAQIHQLYIILVC